MPAGVEYRESIRSRIFSPENSLPCWRDRSTAVHPDPERSEQSMVVGFGPYDHLPGVWFDVDGDVAAVHGVPVGPALG